MTKRINLLALLSCLCLSCRSVIIEQPHIAAIKVVNDAGQGVSGLELDSVYPVSWKTVRAVTGADGTATMTFPVYSTGLRRIKVSMRSTSTKVGEVVIEFGPNRTTFFGVAEHGHYTELDPDGGVLRKRKLSNVLPVRRKESGEVDRSHE